jgi:hypothetical protein
MDGYAVLLFIHILSLVFWLGTDIGVFVLGKFAQNPGYSVEQRLLLLKVALILDMFPRVFMVLTLPSGFHLATAMGAIPYSLALIAGVWAFSAVWLVIVLTGLLRHEAPIGKSAKKVEKIIQYVLFAVLAWAGLASLLTGDPITTPWIAVKVLMYASILVIIQFLEKAFFPAVAGFLSLESSGSSPQLESQIRGGMDRVYLWVLAIYAVVIVSAFLGVAKPGLGI